MPPYLRLIFPIVIAFSLSASGAVSAGAVTLPKGPLWHTAQRAEWACVMLHESHSTFAHLNLSDNNRYGSSGIFQIEQSTWQAHQRAAGVPLSVHVWQATPLQQEKVAYAIWRADGWGPWSADGCFR